jgi:DNA polymerase I
VIEINPHKNDFTRKKPAIKAPYTLCCNFPEQATASDGFKSALVAIDDGLKGLDARIVHILHDEVIVESLMDEAVAVAEIVRRSMEGAFPGMLPGMPFEVKTKERGRWGKFPVIVARCLAF